MTELEKQTEVRRTARALFKHRPDWITFYREILGRHGVVRRLFPTREALALFKQTDAYLDIQKMLGRLRQEGSPPPDPDEPTRVITVRLPKSLHETLRAEAHEHQTSMNKLCISKLLRYIDREMVPAEPWQGHEEKDAAQRPPDESAAARAGASKKEFGADL